MSFNDGFKRIVDFEPFLFAYDRGYYNRYRMLSNFKSFKIEDGNIVWGKDWDLIFPIKELYAGKIKFNKKPLSAKALDKLLSQI